LPESYAVFNSKVKKITFKLQGPRAFFRSIIEEKKEIIINLDNMIKTGQRKYSLNVTELNYQFPLSIKIMDIYPKKISFEIDTKKTKTVPIIIHETGDVGIDHKLVKFQLHPNKVKISGAKKIINSIKNIKTRELDLSLLAKQEIKYIPLVSPYESVELEEKKVKLDYELRPTRSNLKIKNLKIKFISSKYIQAATRNSVDLLVLASKEYEQNISSENIEITAEVPDGAKGWTDVEIKAKLPNHIYLLKVIPSKVKVKVK
jgi:YbbR domain-containing protein